MSNLEIQGYLDPKLLVESPYQPRKAFPDDEMGELEDSIESAGGIKIPLIVRPGSHQIIEGGRRKIIAIKRNDPLVPVYWLTCSDDEAQEIVSLGNVKRADLSPIDEANMVLSLIVARLKLDDRTVAISLVKGCYAAEKKGKPDGNDIVPETMDRVVATIKEFSKGSLTLGAYVNHRLKLLNLPDELMEAVQSSQINYSQATQIAKAASLDEVKALLDRTIDEGLSVAKIKEEVSKDKPQKAPKTPKPKKETHMENPSEEVLDDLPPLATIPISIDRKITPKPKDLAPVSVDRVVGFASKLLQDLRDRLSEGDDCAAIFADLSRIAEYLQKV
jgi:ParB family transcriptional regulator, chromosome partitioning protein